MAPFIVHNLKKKYLEWIQTYDDVSFMGPKCTDWHNQGFFRKSNKILIHFIIQNFQKSGSIVVRIYYFRDQNGSLVQTEKFPEKIAVFS